MELSHNRPACRNDTPLSSPTTDESNPQATYLWIARPVRGGDYDFISRTNDCQHSLVNGLLCPVGDDDIPWRVSQVLPEEGREDIFLFQTHVIGID